MNPTLNNISHTFAVCAYKDSPYLKKCILSLINQNSVVSEKSKIIICTSTPSEYIECIAKKYKIPLYIREGEGDIRDDWNYAYNMADSDWVTIAHQDDIYAKTYGNYVLDIISENESKRNTDLITMIFTDYYPLKNSKMRDVNSVIRRILRYPIKYKCLSDKVIIKKMILSMGNTICCPTVTYNKKLLGENIFTTDMKYNIDWDTFMKIANIKGRFAYVDRPLVKYRMHKDATSNIYIQNNLRESEDYRMFCKIWPEPITKLIMFLYKSAYKTYE